MLNEEAREWLKHGKEMDSDYASQVDDYIRHLEEKCLVQEKYQIKKNLFLLAETTPEIAMQFRVRVLSEEFKDRVNPTDGVVYPEIAELSEVTQKKFRLLIEEALGQKILPKVTFARMMTAGVSVPHRIHDDHIMGQYSAHLYLSKEWPAGSGTAFWEYKGDRTLSWSGQTDVPHNDKYMWKQYALAPAAYGRLLIHAAELWHSAEPTQGFGTSKQDARLVLTCFFDLAPEEE